MALFKRKKDELDLYTPASGSVNEEKGGKKEAEDLFVPEKGSEGAQPLEIPVVPAPPMPPVQPEAIPQQPAAPEVAIEPVSVVTPEGIPQQPTAPEVAPVTPDVAVAAENAPVQPEEPSIDAFPSTPEQKKPGAAASQKDDSQDDSQDDDGAQPNSGPAKPEQQEKVEKVLSGGLTELYQAMTPAQQQKFRVKGEEAAKSITTLVTQFKATAKKVVAIIRDWLSTIPGVNKYFLEQESKLKTDEIIKLQRKMKEEARVKNIHQ